MDGLYLPPKPAIIMPRSQEIVRPTDPRFKMPPLVSAGMILNPYSFGGVAATVSFRASYGDTANLTSYSFAASDIGTASADRYIIVAAYAGSGVSMVASGVTIAGITATQIGTGLTGLTTVSFWGALVPTGSTGTIVVTYPSAAARAGISVWATTGLQSLTAVDTGTSTANPLEVTGFDVSAGGIAIGAAYAQTGTSATWLELTENVDTTTNLEGDTATGASKAYAAAQTGLAPRCTWASSSSPGMQVISLR